MGLNSENNNTVELYEGFTEEEIQAFLDEIDREKESLGANQITPDIYGVGYKTYRDPNEAAELGYLTQEEKNKFANEHMGLLYAVARKHYPQFDTDTYSEEDVISACHEGMAKGLNGYYREMKCTCETFVYRAMENACLDMKRMTQRKKEMKISASLDDTVTIKKKGDNSEKKALLGDVTPDTSDFGNPERAAAASRREEILQILLDKLHPEDKYVLVMGMGLDENKYCSEFGVAEFFHITQKDARKKLKKAQKKLLKVAEEMGYANELMMLAYT